MSARPETERDEPVVRSPQLQRFVDAVRAEPAVETTATLGAIRRQIAAKGRGFQTGVAAGVALAAAAAAAFWLLVPGVAPAAQHLELTERSPEVPSPSYVPYSDELRLSDSVRVTWRGGAPPQALGAWELGLGRGSYEVALAEERPERLLVRIAGRVLELAHGEVRVSFHGDVPVVSLRSGVAAWVAADGTRTPLAVDTLVAQRDPSAARGESGIDLAREAEELFAAGQRRAAILLLRKLALRHPGSSAAPAALLDLGRELKRDGLPDHARCAYRLYLERWPQGELRAEVRTNLGQLGPGPTCDGLDPV